MCSTFTQIKSSVVFSPIHRWLWLHLNRRQRAKCTISLFSQTSNHITCTWQTSAHKVDHESRATALTPCWTNFSLFISLFLFHILAGHRAVHSVTRSCVVCWRVVARPQPQMMGQLPFECVTPGSAFDTVRLDYMYAGPVMIKYGYVRKPTLVKAYICVLFPWP